METCVSPTDTTAAETAARTIAAEAWGALSTRSRFTLAVSGGQTPWLMLRALAREAIPWERVHIFQVDERVAAANHPDRNLTHLKESLLLQSPLPPSNIHAMPVELEDLEDGANRYARLLREICGSPAVLDLVHLGLGTDGHTASLVPKDPVLEVNHADVSTTGEYMGHRRMTLTYPILNRARRILWLVTGGAKAQMLARLRMADASIPAGRISQVNSLIVADLAAANAGGGNQATGKRS